MSGGQRGGGEKERAVTSSLCAGTEATTDIVCGLYVVEVEGVCVVDVGGMNSANIAAVEDASMWPLVDGSDASAVVIDGGNDDCRRDASSRKA